VASVYRPSAADGMRLDGMLNAVQWSLICMGVAGLTDGVRHAGPTTINPDASEHWLGGWGALVGALTLALAVAPTATGHAYGAVLHGCTLAGHQLQAHPIRTRMAGYAAALTGAALSLGAGTYLALQSKHEEAGRLPGTPAPYNAVYHQWGALALIGSSMGIASAGWYAGRLGSAALYAIAGR
jgi:hypothetical protein